MPNMELPGNYFSRLPSFNLGFQPTDTLGITEEDDKDMIHVAVGKSIEKSVQLLHWTFRRFGNREIGLVHVHRPSSTIPTLLGKLPVSRANEEMVIAHRREEKEKCTKLISHYLTICSKAKVKATTFTIESEDVQKGIVDLVNEQVIRKLVMGAAIDNYIKVQQNTNKANYTSRNAPAFCQIWFVSKGRHVWTRESSENCNTFISIPRIAIHHKDQKLRSKSSYPQRTEEIIDPTFIRFNSCPSSARVGNWMEEKPDHLGVSISSNRSTLMDGILQSASSPGHDSAESKVLSEYNSDSDEKSYYKKILKTRTAAEKWKNEAFAELLKRRRLELKSLEAIDKVKAFETACAHEVQLRKEVENMMKITRQEQEQLTQQRKDISRELQKTKKIVEVINSHVNDSNFRQKEAARELELIQMSLKNLQHERENMHGQKEGARRQVGWWKSHGQVGVPDCGDCGLVNISGTCVEFSLFDLEIATCSFSESFIITQGGHDFVYKGEINDRSVAIKKLHPLDMEGTLEFQHEVEVLSKLEHPNLVTLIGACPEAWSLVYEYLPNGSIQDHLFSRTGTSLTWKIRTRIIADMSSALFYLHSFEAGTIIHGDLKPENILLDSDFNCKIGDFGICKLVPQQIARSPSFRGMTEMKSAFPYRDPELRSPEDMTPKSDLYSFGVIILQLLTGRSPVGLATEVRRAVSCGNLMSILDQSAGEWPTFVAKRLIDFGLQCCELKSRDRPDLKPSLVKELQTLLLSNEQPVPSFFLCPILQELMYDPHIAADGFTYEGEALLGWLNNGRQTSPMTNLPLSNVHLTPNHALRLAIKDWLCQS